MCKILKISVQRYNDSSMLELHDCNNIINQFDSRELTYDNYARAIDFIVSYLYMNRCHTAIADIHERNKQLMSPKEMTIGEIEELLGYEIKIVKEENKDE